MRNTDIAGSIRCDVSCKEREGANWRPLRNWAPGTFVASYEEVKPGGCLFSILHA